MGTINQEAVLATTWNKGYIKKVQEWIKVLDEESKTLFVFVPGVCEGRVTVLFAPDGSKKGWPEAEKYSGIRSEFIALLKSFDYDDGSNPFDWVEVGYGEYGQAILNGNCENRYNNNPYAVV